MISRSRLPQPAPSKVGPAPFLLLVTFGFSLLPDLDSIVGLAAGDFGRFHNNLTHSLLVGAVVALAFGALLQRVRGRGFWYWFVISLVSYELHVLMDWATVGRGVMAWWPLAEARFSAPVLLFYGLHWSQGWLSMRHIWTLVTELAFSALLVRALQTIAVWRSKARA